MSIQMSRLLTYVPPMQCVSCGASFPGRMTTPTTCPACGASPFLDRRLRGGVTKTTTVFALWRSEEFAAHFETMLRMGRTRPFLSLPALTCIPVQPTLLPPDLRADGPWKIDLADAGGEGE